MASDHVDDVARVISLTTGALRNESKSALSGMLQSVAEMFDCCGCIVWELLNGPGGNPSEGRLFVLAHWMKDGKGFAIHDMPATGSVSGEAIMSGQPINVTDIDNDPRVHRGAAFEYLKRHNVRALYSIPIALSGESQGALNLYRDVPEPLSKKALEDATQLSSLVVKLYDSVWDKVSLKLIGSVRNYIQEVEKARSIDKPRFVIDRLSTIISEAFDALETSIFLEHRIEKPGTFELAGTTCSEFVRKNPYRKGDSGLTGWVLSNARPVRILDLNHFASDIDWIHREYADITWQDSANGLSITPELLHSPPGSELQPLSFMAAPIVVGDDVLGVVRCCTAKTPPYYYADREVALLSLVASQIGHFWNTYLGRYEMEDENRSWSGLVESLTKLNNFAQTELNKTRPDERRIFAEGLRVAGNVIKGANIMDVRLYDKEKQVLYFDETAGQAWKAGGDLEFERRRKIAFPITGDKPQSAGAWVFQQDKVRVMSDVTDDEYYQETFRGVRRMVIAPMSLRGEKYGVLDIRGTGDRGFPRNAESITALLAQQMALYRYLAVTIGKLRKAEADLNQSVEVQTHVYQDLEHQLKSPVIQTQIRANALLSGKLTQEAMDYNLMAIRGLTGKAKQVVRSVGIFADLAQNKKLRLRTVPVKPELLLKMLFEVCADSKLLNGERRGLNYSVDKSSFDVLAEWRFIADMDLLFQVLANVVDNAFKYSFDFSTVRISGGITRSAQFFIKVGNKGLSFPEEDAKRSIERGWRGTEAKWSTGSGSGIGLWIVDHVLKAHGGQLLIVPTTSERWTEVSLIFPVSRRSKEEK